MNLYHTGLSELYMEIEALGDPLTGISDRIDFERIRPILSDLFTNDTEKGGRPNYDPVLMVKILLLQQWYNLSDPQIEREIRDRISFMNFLDYPEKLPDRNTIWYFRARLSKTGKDRLVFNEIRDQIMARHIRIKPGTMPGMLRSICESWTFAGVTDSFSMILISFTRVCALYPKCFS